MLSYAGCAQNINAVDTISNTFEILKPAFDLLLDPAVRLCVQQLELPDAARCSPWLHALLTARR